MLVSVIGAPPLQAEQSVNATPVHGFGPPVDGRNMHGYPPYLLRGELVAQASQVR